mmetsp:Transcript_16175/g.30802  ORF Transcript_16175/g.30802 Transcript_16175/m.30802 type:complete len:205 (+) Transcript_16175:1889-2503(+)
MTRKKKVALVGSPTKRFASPPGWEIISFTTSRQSTFSFLPSAFLFADDVFVRMRSAGWLTMAPAIPAMAPAPADTPRPSGPTPICTGRAPSPIWLLMKVIVAVAIVSKVKNLTTAKGSSRLRIGAKPDHNGSQSRGSRRCFKSKESALTSFSLFSIMNSRSTSVHGFSSSMAILRTRKTSKGEAAAAVRTVASVAAIRTVISLY